MSLSVLGEAVLHKLKVDLQFESSHPPFEQDDDVTSAPDPLSNPQSRRSPVEVHYVA